MSDEEEKKDCHGEGLGEKSEQMKEPNQMLIWKNTMDDGMLPFSGLSAIQSEKDPKDLKDFDHPDSFSGNLVTEKITKTEELHDKESGQKYPLKQILYCPTIDGYVQIKKYIVESNSYVCRVIVPNEVETSPDVTISEKDLWRKIKVNVQLI